ncbi:histone deacetylase family protein [soil metagenome]
MTTLFSTHPRFADHDTGPGHPERPARLEAVARGARAAGLDGALVPVEPRAATRAEVARVHPPEFLDALEHFCAAGGGQLDADTHAGQASYDAALLGAGAGLDAIERLDRGEAGAAFCAVRPPGHHASATRAMGFCLLNNIAVAAASLADRGERVLVVDIDAHHGNGTQRSFFDDPRVVYASFHQYPLFPGTGAIDEVGTGEGVGATVNFALPAGATGDVLRAGVDEVLAPLVDDVEPTWLLVSAGFDGHRRDPLTGLALSSGDYADLTTALCAFAPAGRRLLFLEGGYDLEALADSAGACLAALEGEDHRPEPATSGGPGAHVVADVVKIRNSLMG